MKKLFVTLFVALQSFSIFASLVRNEIKEIPFRKQCLRPNLGATDEPLFALGVTLLQLNIFEQKLDAVEEWRDILGFEGVYLVSNLGNIKIYATGKIKKATLRKGKYVSIALHLGKSAYKNFSVHRLVAIAFIPNPKNKAQVNHKNGIKHDNRVENLEWATASENGIHAYRVLGRVGSNKGKFGKNSFSPCRGISMYSLDGKFIRNFDNTRHVEIELSIGSTNVFQAAKGILRQAKGYMFRFTDSVSVGDIEQMAKRNEIRYNKYLKDSTIKANFK